MEQSPGINIDEMELMQSHIYHGEKISRLSVASSVVGAIEPMAHLDFISRSKVLIRTHGYIREARKQPTAEMRQN